LEDANLENEARKNENGSHIVRGGCKPEVSCGYYMAEMLEIA
jgi:hypothetical protein